MFKRFKNFASVLTIGAVLGSAAMSVGSPSADAGIILAPIGIGIILIIVGVADQSLGLVILSNNDGSLKQDSLTTDLMNKYQHLGIDTQTASDLGLLISRKYQNVRATASNARVSINLTKEELAIGLRASNIEADNPALFNQLIIDLK